MGNTEVRWGISVDEMTKDSWSVGICLSHWVDEAERAAYGLAWKQATDYFNEMMEVHNRHVISQMSDAQFNEFMRNQLDSEN